jgi:hypothetical protein
MSHGDGRQRAKVGAVMPLRVRLIDEPQVGLVYQRGGDERTAQGASHQMAVSNGSKLLIHGGQHTVERLPPPPYLNVGFVTGISCYQ